MWPLGVGEAGLVLRAVGVWLTVWPLNIFSYLVW